MSDFERIKQLIDSVREPNSSRTHRFERFQEILAQVSKDNSLQIPEGGKGVLLIAGTNGKGSVAKTLEVCLQGPTRRVGLYTSPHMMEPTERIRSGGRDLTRDEFVAAFRAIEPYIKDLSHFEILTLMMAEVFFGKRIRPKVDLAILEVGVGGRMDPTRAFPHEISVITQIGLDHTDLLGATIREIAHEKFAIIDPGNDVIFTPLKTDLAQELKEKFGGKAKSWTEAGAYVYEVAVENGEPHYEIHSPWGRAKLSLMGERAVKNTSIALRVLDQMKIDVAQVLPKLEKVEWPCRMERFLIQGRRVYLSGDHNPQGVESLIEILKQFPYRHVHLVVTIAGNKSVDEFLSPIMGLKNVRLHLAKGKFRAAPLERYGKWLDVAQSANEEAEEALDQAIRNSEPEDLIVVTGSLYTVGALRQKFVSQP